MKPEHRTAYKNRIAWELEGFLFALEAETESAPDRRTWELRRALCSGLAEGLLLALEPRVFPREGH